MNNKLSFSDKLAIFLWIVCIIAASYSQQTNAVYNKNNNQINKK